MKFAKAIGPLSLSAVFFVPLLGATASGVVSAQVLEEVVVTARKREENVQDIPIAVTAIGAKQLKEIGFRDLTSVSAMTPNLQVHRNAGGDTALLACMRGLCRSDNIITEDPMVGVYVDGFYVSKAIGSMFDMFDLERVEVLRGPQGTLFGKNTLGGALNVTTSGPSGEWGGSIELEAGNADHFSGRAVFDVPVVEDVLAVKVGYSNTQRDGLIENTGGSEINDIGNQAARFALRLTPGEVFSANYVYDWYEQRQNANPYQATFVQPGVAFIDPNFAGIESTASETLLRTRETLPGGHDNLNVDFHGLTLNFDINENMAFKSLTGYRETGHDSLRLWSPFVLIVGERNVDVEFFSQEFQFVGNAADGVLNYVFGLFYSDEDGEFELDQVFGSAGNGLTIDLDTKNTSYAVYGELTANFTEQFAATFGLRYTNEEREADLRTLTLDQTFVINNISEQAPTNEFDTESVSPRLSLQYRPSEEVMGYFTYARGFKSGGLNGRAASFMDFNTYDDTELDSYELGFKSDLLDGQVRLNAAVFYQEADDLQVQLNSFDPSGAFLSRIENAGKATISGAELEATFVTGGGLQIATTVGYTDPKYDEFLALDFATGLPMDVSDQRNFQFAPEITYSVSPRYEHQFDDGSVLVARLDYSYVDEQFFQTTPSPLIDGEEYSLIDARIEIRSETGVTVGLWGKNLGDEEYRNGGFDIATFGTPGGGDGIGFNSYGSVRTYGIDFRYDFGAANK